MGTVAGDSARERTARRLTERRTGRGGWERDARTRSPGTGAEAESRGAPAGAASPERDRILLLRMVESIHRMESYVRGGRPEFMESTLVQDAVIWNLRLVCHCAKRLSNVEKARHPEVKWPALATLFKTLIRDPWHLDPEQLWHCVDGELAPLKHCFQSILSTERTGR